MLVLTVCSSDQQGPIAGDLVSYSVRFEADLSSLRDAIHQFGRVTSSQSASMNSHDLPSGSSHSTHDEVFIIGCVLFTNLDQSRLI